MNTGRSEKDGKRGTEVAFDQYAKYYDLLYRDKDYAGEAGYIDSLIQKYSGGSAGKLLELGCGTGKHASLLADKGYSVYGIDMSEGMLKEAQNRAAGRNDQRLRFAQSDIRAFKTDETYDAVISFFHVISYLNTDDDFYKVMDNVHTSLKTGGYFCSIPGMGRQFCISGLSCA